MTEKGLSVKQERFCHKFIELGNQTQAYKEVYKCKQLTAEASSARLLSNVKVSARVEELRSELEEKAKEKNFNTMEAFIDIHAVCTQQKKVLKRAKTGKKIKGYIDYDASNAINAAKNIGQMLGNYEKDNNQKGRLSVSVELTEKQQQALESIQRLLGNKD